MTSNPDPVVEIIEEAIRAFYGANNSIPQTAKGVLAALEAAGLRVLPVVPTKEMISAIPDSHYWGDCPTCGGSRGVWEALTRPTTYTPEKSDG